MPLNHLDINSGMESHSFIFMFLVMFVFQHTYGFFSASFIPERYQKGQKQSEAQSEE